MPRSMPVSFVNRGIPPHMTWKQRFRRSSLDYWLLWSLPGPQVCKIMAFMAVILGLGLLFYILLGFR